MTGCEVETVEFLAETPRGPIPMTNIIGRISGASRDPIVLSGHFDTIRADQVREAGRRLKIWRALQWSLGRRSQTRPSFTGANDGGSSAGLLLALAEFLAQTSRDGSVWFAFFDGEEAQTEWTKSDQTYGSRHQVDVWRQRDELRQIRGLINIDMIGSHDLQMLFDLGSNASLRDQIWATAERLGYGDFFDRRYPSTIGDDHIPFVKAGISAVDLIDREYGPRNGFWHTCEDDMDKLNPQSFSIVAHVVCEVLADLGVFPPIRSTSS